MNVMSPNRNKIYLMQQQNTKYSKSGRHATEVMISCLIRAKHTMASGARTQRLHCSKAHRHHKEPSHTTQTIRHPRTLGVTRQRSVYCFTKTSKRNGSTLSFLCLRRKYSFKCVICFGAWSYLLFLQVCSVHYGLWP